MRVAHMNPAARIFFDVKDVARGLSWKSIIKKRLPKDAPPLYDIPLLLEGAMERQGAAELVFGGRKRRIWFRAAEAPEGLVKGDGYMIVIENRERGVEEKPFAERMISLVENFSEAVIICHVLLADDGSSSPRPLAANKAAEKLLRTTARKLTNAPLGEGASWVFDDELISVFAKAAADPSRHKKVKNAVVTRVDGSRAILPLTVKPLGEGLIAIVFGDESETKAGYEERARLLAVIQDAGEAIVITDKTGTIQYVNPAFERVTGYSGKEAIGGNPRMLKSGAHDPDFYKDMWKTITSGNTWRGDIVNRRKDGSLYHNYASIAPVKNENCEITSYVGVMQDITERKKAEEELKLSEERISAIINTVGEGVIVVGADSRIRFINREFSRIFGHGEKELVGQHVSVIMPGKYRKAHMAGITRYLSGGPARILGRRVELEGLRKDGSVFPLELMIQETRVGRDGEEDRFFTGAIRDISDRRAVEEALRASEQRFRETLENIHLLAVRLDTRGNITFINDYSLDLAGWKRKDVLGKNWFDVFIAPEAREEMKKAHSDIVREGVHTPHYESEIIAKNGERRIISWSNTPSLDPRGNIIGVTSIGEDITERYRLEDELREQARKLQEMAGFKDKMVSVISHDLRSPLTSIIGLMNLLLRSKTDPLSDRQRKIVASMKDSAAHQLNLVENLTELSKVRRGKIKINPERVRAADIMSASASILRQMARDKGIHIAERLDQKLWIEVDKEKMVQVVNNLVANSVKFTERGGSVTLSTESAEDEVELVVKDTGVGIDSDRLEKLFDLNERTTSYGTEGEKGSGLGLSICREIITLHGGELAIESKPGKGTTVRLRLKVS